MSSKMTWTVVSLLVLNLILTVVTSSNSPVSMLQVSVRDLKSDFHKFTYSFDTTHKVYLDRQFNLIKSVCQ